MQIHSWVFALRRQINKQKVCEKNNLLCASYFTVHAHINETKTVATPKEGI